MLFNSYDFALYFLPVALVVFYLLARLGGARFAAAWLALASVFFYGYWAPRFVPLLLGSIACNFGFGLWMRRVRVAGHHNAQAMLRAILAIAVSANLGVLFYFKYADFFIRSVNFALGSSLSALGVILPIGISFFTFTQIAYLVDTYQGKVKETDPWHYLLFVTFFPHLIAGPILHHSEMMPQFGRRETYRVRIPLFASGVLIFAIGLGKKVIFADGIQPYVAPVFDYAPGQPLSLVVAWGGALAYTLQLYFDFSGYSDMAIGLSRMFNIDLPLNFESPYKAVNISDFWRRWHMTLSRFLRDYLYFPLGGNRYGKTRRYYNLLVTMVLGGLWHGAAWTFVAWGALHGLYLCCYHGWVAVRERLGFAARDSFVGRLAARTLTMVCVIVGWVFFRAESFPAALRVLEGMAGMNGAGLPERYVETLIAKATASGPVVTLANAPAAGDERQLVWTLGLLAIALLLPNTQQIVRWPAEGIRTLRIPALLLLTGVLLAVILLMLIINASRGISEFIYFNF